MTCKHEVWLIPDMALFHSMRNHEFTVRCKECGCEDKMEGWRIAQAMQSHMIAEQIDKANRIPESRPPMPLDPKLEAEIAAALDCSESCDPYREEEWWE